jgi:ankyrin repeat protein
VLIAVPQDDGGKKTARRRRGSRQRQRGSDSDNESDSDSDSNSDSSVDLLDQIQLDEDMVTACLSGTIVELEAALEMGADVNAYGGWGLQLACARTPDDEDVVPIVQLLLRLKCSVSVLGDEGWCALHCACRHSSAQVVRLLLEADAAAVRQVTSNEASCLHISVNHVDVEESLKIATLLLGAGCDVNAVDEQRKTVLMFAARHNRAEMASLLIARGADVQARNANGMTALHFACLNVAFGRDIIPVLCAAGADATAPEASGFTPLELAMMQSRAMAHTVVPYLPAGFQQDHLVICPADPVGILSFVVELGATVFPSNFGVMLLRGRAWPASQHWASLRNGKPLLLDESDDDAFGALLTSSDAALWKWASSEPQMQQHPITGDTIFHLLCETEALDVQAKLVVLKDLKRRYRNPLVPNRFNGLCVALAREPELKKALQEYACWQPQRRVMEWFGPLFQKRAWTVLLVCYRLKAPDPKKLAGLNRDIRHLLVKYASRVEYIYVPFLW